MNPIKFCKIFHKNSEMKGTQSMKEISVKSGVEEGEP
jgi:hypothetical protein